MQRFLLMQLLVLAAVIYADEPSKAETRAPAEVITDLFASLNSKEAFDAAFKIIEQTEMLVDDQSVDLTNYMLKCCSIWGTDAEQRRIIRNFAKPAKSVLKIMEAVLPNLRTEEATDAQLTTLAMQLSESARAFPIEEYLSRSSEGSWINLASVETLKEMLGSDPVVQNATHYLEEMRKINFPLYCLIKRERVRTGITPKESILDCIDAEEPLNKMRNLILDDYAYNEFIEYMRSKQNAISAVKDFATLINAFHSNGIKTTQEILPKYDDVQSALAESPRLAAISELYHSLYPHLHPYVESYAPFVMPLMFGIDAFSTTDATSFQVLQTYLYADVAVLFAKSLSVDHAFSFDPIISSETREVLDDAIFSQEPLLSEEVLSKVKAKSKVAYNALYLLNDHCRVMLRRDGLSEKAYEFLKQVYTIQNMLGALSWTVSFDEAAFEKIKADAELMIQRFVDLPVDVRKELIHRFPSHAIFHLVFMK